MNTAAVNNKVAIVTGASSGIGRDTVLALLKGGFVVYGAARRVGEMGGLEAAGARTGFLDLTDEGSIKALVRRVVEEQGRIDVLVNNAGYGFYGAIEDIPMDEARRQFEVNVFGLAMMTNAVLPTMRAQRSGRIVHVGSVGGKVWSVLGGWYQATKFALEGLADCTRNELRPFGIDVILIEPGAIKSEWLGIVVKNLEKTSGAGPYKPIADGAVEFYKSIEHQGVPPRVIADTIMRAVTVRRPKARYVAPGVAKGLLMVRALLSDRLFDALMSRVMRIPKSV